MAGDRFCPQDEPFGIDPGVCADCYQAPLMASGQWTDDPGRAEGVGRAYLEGSVAHCNETDAFPRRCEFVVYTYQRMSRSNVLVLVVMAAVVIVPLLHEMQQARRDLQLLQHRLPSLGGGCGRRVVRLAAWCITTLRTVLLPATVVLTTAGVLLSLIHI